MQESVDGAVTPGYGLCAPVLRLVWLHGFSLIRFGVCVANWLVGLSGASLQV
jgi:hypothetical protein